MIEKVEVVPWCISCRTCETVCPSIFHVSPKSKVISHNYVWKESEILQAEIMCPVNVIKVKKQWGLSINFQHATLVSKVFLTPNIIELIYKHDTRMNIKPGQYISLQMNDKWWKFSRSYSIADYWDNSFTLNVKLEKYWRGSKYLKSLKTKSRITYLGPLWSFYVKNQENSQRKVFIATWTGLAPIYNMIQHLPKETPKLLILWARYEDDIYYLDKLSHIENLDLVLKISRPHQDYMQNKWRVTDELSRLEQDEDVYICWNPLMIDDVKKQLDQFGYKASKIHHEAFTSSHTHTWTWKDIIYNWSIPYKKEISTIIIAFSLICIPIAWFYMRLQDNLYWSFFVTDNFMWLLYDISWFSVVLVMAVRPLKDIFPRIWIFRTLCYYRKALWILSSIIIVTHLFWWLYFNPASLERYFMSARWEVWLALTARLSEITALILLLTSNDISQKILWQWWKHVQRSSYIYFITWGIMAAQLFPLKVYPFMCIVIILYIIAEIMIYKRKNNT